MCGGTIQGFVGMYGRTTVRTRGSWRRHIFSTGSSPWSSCKRNKSRELWQGTQGLRSSPALARGGVLGNFGAQKPEQLSVIAKDGAVDVQTRGEAVRDSRCTEGRAAAPHRQGR